LAGWGGWVYDGGMIIGKTIEAVRSAVAEARVAGRSIHFVPTMGALHEGHLSLVRAARGPGRFVVVSIFVNPTQFGPNEDLAQYPRPIEADLEKCRAEDVDLVYLPPVEAIYPEGFCTTVHVAGVTEHLCGAHRPGHFDGVTTVVAKLLNIVQPDVAYFGQKDAQQAAAIGRMVADLNMPVSIAVCPTVREPDGLALSSRNAYLGEAERKQARSLYAALRAGEDAIAHGERDAAGVTAVMRRHIEQAGPCRIDYVEVAEPATMRPVVRIAGPVVLAVAVRIGDARLIDNLPVDVPADGG
jgi:pantoate--beta-alanine ligase